MIARDKEILDHVREYGPGKWKLLEEAHGIKENTACARWLRVLRDTEAGQAALQGHPVALYPTDEEGHVVLEARGPRSLAELLDEYGIPYTYDDDGNPDPIGYTVSQFRANSWEQHSVRKGFVTLWQTRAVLVPTFMSAEAMKRMWLEFKEDAENHAPVKVAPKPPTDLSGGEPCMLKVCIYDPHIGMLAWGREVGKNYDLEIAKTDYLKVAERLISIGRLYPIERVVYVVGHDLFHADTMGTDVRGHTRGGATTGGTMQDLDTRLPRLFTHIRRTVVAAIDLARTVAPVDVVCVPGNHDQQTVYKFGEVLNAWYRNDPDVDIRYGPSKRSYYLYGNTIFMDTHGEEFKRKRDNLVSVFATECPPEMWAAAKYREIHVGHNHINMEKVFTGDPRERQWEGRATRVRSLPGLTPEDSWHYEEGYKHTRAATALVFRRSGGVAGLHEFVL